MMARRDVTGLYCLLLLSQVLLACIGQCSAFNFRQCPSWLHEYENFHRTARSRPAAKYLVAAPQIETGNGLGDRVRGMLYAARLAAATNRVLLYSWDLPGEEDITLFLKPARAIDWRLAGTAAEGLDLMHDGKDVELHTWGVGPQPDYVENRAFIASGGLAHTTKKVLVVRSNEHPNTTCVDCMDVHSSMDIVCIFQFLMQPSDEVERQANAHLQALYHGSHVKQGYAAVHLRLGQPWEKNFRNRPVNQPVDAPELSVVLDAIPCGMWLGKSAGINMTSTPLLLLTDHNGICKFAQQRRLADVVTTGFEAVHFGQHENHSLQQRYSVLVDITLLARARCLVMSPSGFSTTAWYLGGGKKCTMDIRHCVNTCSTDFNNPMCSK